MDVTGAVELFVNQRARSIAPVRLTGNYGSEILRGNIAFTPGPQWNHLLAPGFQQLVDRARATYAAERSGHPLSFIAFKQVPWHHYKRFAVERSQIIPRSPFLDNQLVALAYQAPPNAIRSRDASFHLIAAGNPRLGRIPTDRALRDRPIPLVTPFCHRWQEFTFKAEYAYDYGMPQFVARIDHYLAPLRLERLFLGRHKFYHFRHWYRKHLAPYLKDVLLDARTLQRPYFDGEAIRKIVAEHTRGIRNHTNSIHLLLTTELIHRTLIERA
jgi:asparagine synthase (glutamine-hydrolysing)